jgi:hypothetical protein
MKKILLLILFMVLSYLGYSQQRGNVFIVPTWTTNFTMSLPVHTFVYCIDSSKIYRLLAIGQPTKNLSNTVNTVYPVPVTAGLYADSSGVSGFAWKIDTTHNWGYLKTDSLSSCSTLVIYSNDTSYYTALGHKFNSNVDADSYINTDSSYYIKGIEFIKANHNLGNQFIGVGSGANNIVDSINYPPYGYLGSLNTANGYYSLYNNTMGLGNTANGAQSLYSNTTGYNNIANGYKSLYSNTEGYNNIANGYQSLFSNTTGYENIANGAASLFNNTTGSGNIAIGYKSGQYADTAANGLLWIGEGDYNNAIIYGNMLTDSLRLNANVNVGTNLMVNQSATIGTDLTVHGEIINGGLINKDTVLILADDETFEFPTTSVGWAEIQCDSSLIEKTWGVVSWNGDGSTSLRSNGAKFVNTDIDGNYACFYDGGVYAILKNTSGYTQTYSIKYHYHN